MDMTEISTCARQMFERAGTEAIAIAARRTSECEARGDLDGARDWHRIRLSLMERAGPRAT